MSRWDAFTPAELGVMADALAHYRSEGIRNAFALGNYVALRSEGTIHVNQSHAEGPCRLHAGDGSIGMNTPHQIRPGQIYRAVKPVRDPAYLRFVKMLPCAACLKSRQVDPCHTGPHGIGQKSCDLSCIPLCRKCHQEFDADPRGFTGRHGMDIPALIARLNEFYRTKICKDAACSAWDESERGRVRAEAIEDMRASFPLEDCTEAECDVCERYPEATDAA